MKNILAIDQGTSSTKALIFDASGKVIARGTEALHTNYLDCGIVEQDPEDIYQNVLAAVRNCLENSDSKRIDAMGIDNQRETFVIWDESGAALHPAIVWQCKRSTKICEELISKGYAALIADKTGLVIDPYFSATKLIWLARNKPEIAESIRNGKVFFGTIDTWLLWKLTNGRVYATDHTNASRTMLFNLHTLQWDEELVGLFGLEGLRLPVIHPSSHHYALTNLGGLLPEEAPVCAMVGDSHAAAFGEACFEEGTAKATLGTGCSILMNIGSKPLPSRNGMVTTVCWSMRDRIDFAFEGVIVTCGGTIEWLKNELHLFDESRDTEAIALSASDNGGVYIIPAFSGLGSPHWQMDRKASISGLTFSSTKAHLVRAALESIAYQIKDVIVAMENDASLQLKQLHANGGISANKFVVQFLTDLLNKNVIRDQFTDLSAFGAAGLAGLEAGIFVNLDELKKLKTSPEFSVPSGHASAMEFYEGWKKAISLY